MSIARVSGIVVVSCAVVFTYLSLDKRAPVIAMEPQLQEIQPKDGQSQVEPIRHAEVKVAAVVSVETKTDPVVEEFSESTKQAIARLISRNHYLQPDYQIVLQQTESRNSIQRYLSTLDAYSRIASSSEMAFIKTRSQTNRVGPGVDYLFDGSDVLVFPVYGGDFNNKVSETAVLLQSVNNKTLDVTDFKSYEFLAAVEENDNVEFKVFTPEQADARSGFASARSFENAPVRYYLNGDALVLEIRQFQSGYTGLVISAIEAAEQTKRFVIDLRFSPGGDIYAMTDWLSLLLPENQLISLLQTKRYADPTELKTLSGQLPLTKPISILISRFTASSAEIFARVLESNNAEQVQTMGEATKGKCLAQKSFTVNSEFSLVLSTHEVLMADKKSCNGNRLQPEVEFAAIEFKSIDEILSRVK